MGFFFQVLSSNIKPALRSLKPIHRVNSVFKIEKNSGITLLVTTEFILSDWLSFFTQNNTPNFFLEHIYIYISRYEWSLPQCPVSSGTWDLSSGPHRVAGSDSWQGYNKCPPHVFWSTLSDLKAKKKILYKLINSQTEYTALHVNTKTEKQFYFKICKSMKIW